MDRFLFIEWNVTITIRKSKNYWCYEWVDGYLFISKVAERVPRVQGWPSPRRQWGGWPRSYRNRPSLHPSSPPLRSPAEPHPSPFLHLNMYVRKYMYSQTQTVRLCTVGTTHLSCATRPPFHWAPDRWAYTWWRAYRPDRPCRSCRSRGWWNRCCTPWCSARRTSSPPPVRSGRLE